MRTASLTRVQFQGHLADIAGSARTGALTCRAANQAIARGGYVKHRVFFLDERTAKAAGYRPCAVCMPAEYEAWKATQRPKPKNA